VPHFNIYIYIYMIYCKLVLVLNIAINKLCFLYLCTNVALGWTIKLDYHREQGTKEDIMDRIKLVSQKSRLLQDKRRIISADIG
jgi:hypothetical protein